MFIKIMTQNAVFCRLVHEELNVSYETSIFRSMFMLHKYWQKNNYSEETELDTCTNPSLTLARTLTLSTGERNFGNFTSRLVTTPLFFNFEFMNSQKNLGRDPPRV